MGELKWTDADEIGFQLSEKFPDADPLTLQFTDLHSRVVGLDEFADSPPASSEKALEAIQMAWLEYYRESHE